MEKITYPIKHSKDAILYTISQFFERAAYYGIRALVVIYMTDLSLNMENENALEVYGWLAFSLIPLNLVGALIGDLIIGHKKTLIIGNLFQILGCLALCIESKTGFFIGLGSMAIGSGIYSPNIKAAYGKQYLDKKQLLYGAFTLFYMLVNLGAFVGIMLIGRIGEEFSYIFGFLVGAVFSILSLIMIFLTSGLKTSSEEENFTMSKRFSVIAITIVIVGLFWSIYGFTANSITEIQMLVSNSIPEISWTMFQSVNAVSIIAFGIIFTIIWSMYYNNAYIKLGAGFILAGIGLALLMVEISSIYNLVPALIFIAFAEILIAPVIQSIIVRYTRPKYLATIFAIATIPPMLFNKLVNLSSETLYGKETSFFLSTGTVAMLLAGIVVLVIRKINSQKA
ncbi:MAG: MFS transporter [Flavobacteriaceae bacterium]|nr:MFS transporter [Flavobacteriaceae bacterium]